MFGSLFPSIKLNKQIQVLGRNSPWKFDAWSPPQNDGSKGYSHPKFNEQKPKVMYFLDVSPASNMAMLGMYVKFQRGSP